MTAEDSEKRTTTKRTRAVIDRIEDGGRAVVQLGDDKSALVDLPVSLLPEGASDGDHLIISVKLDRASRDSTSERIRALQEKLEKRGSESRKD
jgi:hypothetical protein